MWSQVLRWIIVIIFVRAIVSLVTSLDEDRNRGANGENVTFGIATVLLILLTLLYIRWDARREIWILLTTCIVMSLIVPTTLRLFRELFVLWIVFYILAMLQLYIYLFEDFIVNAHTVVFLNLMFHAAIDYADIWIMLQTLNPDAKIFSGYNVYTATYVCTIFAIGLHTQSFPSSISRAIVRTKAQEEEEGVKAEEKSELFLERTTTGIQRVAATGMTIVPVLTARGRGAILGTSILRGLRKCWSGVKWIVVYPRGTPNDDDYSAVIVSRKRSAVVSLMFVDIPFLIFRAGLMIESNDRRLTYLPLLLSKNFIFAGFQSLMIRMVQKLEVTRTLHKTRYKETTGDTDQATDRWPPSVAAFGDLMEWTDMPPEDFSNVSTINSRVTRAPTVTTQTGNEKAAEDGEKEDSEKVLTRLGKGVRAWKTRAAAHGNRRLRRFVWRFTVFLIGITLSFLMARVNWYDKLQLERYTDLKERGTILGITPMAVNGVL